MHDAFGFTSDFRPPKMSADICVMHDDLGWKNLTTRNSFRQRKVAETPKLAGRLSMQWLTFRTSSKVERSKVKVPKLFITVIKDQSKLQNATRLPDVSHRTVLL